MIMEQANGGRNKRDVVDGQFEDPDDIEAKRLKLTLPAGSVTVETPQTPRVPHQAPFAPSVSKGIALTPTPDAGSSNSSPRVPPPPHEALKAPPPGPLAIPPVQGVAPVVHPAANGMHPPNGMNPWMMNPTVMAAWQHQQQAFMMGRMYAMMHQNPQMMPPQGVLPKSMMQPTYMPPRSVQPTYIPPGGVVQPTHLPPGGMWVPVHHPGMPPNAASSVYPYPANPPAQKPSEQQQQPASELRQDEAAWHIPYSHNYHPRTGFVPGFLEKQKAAQAKAEKSAPAAKAEKSHPEPPKNMASLDEAELSNKHDFPLIKGDTEKQFGLKDFEFTKKDVLCGRGSVTNTHPGNVRYRNLIDQYRWHYATVKKARKIDVARIIVKKIREDHGRFLKKDGDRWYEVGDEAALAKSAQTLREGLAKIYREGLRTKMKGAGDVEEDEDVQKEIEKIMS
jgi:hypothetical protein